jgi:hypothetical protein
VAADGVAEGARRRGCTTLDQAATDRRALGALGDDAIELVSEDPDPEVARDRAEETAALGAEAPVEAYLDAPGAPEASAEPDDPSDESDVADEDDARRHEPPARKPVKKTRGRASVPSWDEIMFGSGDEDHA